MQRGEKKGAGELAASARALFIRQVAAGRAKKLNKTNYVPDINTHCASQKSMQHKGTPERELHGGLLDGSRTHSGCKMSEVQSSRPAA